MGGGFDGDQVFSLVLSNSQFSARCERDGLFPFRGVDLDGDIVLSQPGGELAIGVMARGSVYLFVCEDKPMGVGDGVNISLRIVVRTRSVVDGDGSDPWYRNPLFSCLGDWYSYVYHKSGLFCGCEEKCPAAYTSACRSLLPLRFEAYV